MNDLFALRWLREGKACPSRIAPRKRCKAPMHVTRMHLPVGPKRGPQGVALCENGHSIWIWPEDCERVHGRVE